MNIKDLRNVSSHIMELSFDEFNNLRKNIISKVNTIINLLFPLEVKDGL